MVDQCVSDIYRSAMLEHILPESKVGQESDKVVLKVVAEEAFRLWVGLHFAVVGESKKER